MAEDIQPGDWVEVVANSMVAGNPSGTGGLKPGDVVKVKFFEEDWVVVEIPGRTFYSLSGQVIIPDAQFLLKSEVIPLKKPLVQDELFRQLLGD